MTFNLKDMETAIHHIVPSKHVLFHWDPCLFSNIQTFDLLMLCKRLKFEFA